jgi:hydroxypyruvate isomerase
MPKFAANLTLMFNEVPFLERFAAARENGFDAVEFLFPYAFGADAIREQLDLHGLELVLCNLPAGDWAAGERGIACDPARVAEFRASVALALDYAGKLGVKRMHCLAGIVPAGASQEIARATYLDNLRFAAAALQTEGMELLIEPINTYDIPGYFLNGSAQAADIIAECGAQNLFLQYDIYHMQRMEGELAATIGKYLPLIRHMQLADAPGRHEPGTGEIDFPALFRAIDAIGYTGWIGCEYVPLADTSTGLGWRERLLA